MRHTKKITLRHEKPTIAERLGELMDIPADLSCGMTLELRGRNELLLCGCRQIVEYSNTCIRIVLGKSTLCLLGRRLRMSSYSEGRIVVRGEIDAFDFCGGACFGEKEETE